jgi:hypothetical protein
VSVPVRANSPVEAFAALGAVDVPPVELGRASNVPAALTGTPAVVAALQGVVAVADWVVPSAKLNWALDSHRWVGGQPDGVVR